MSDAKKSCPKCSAELPSDANFCSRCGTTLGEPIPAASVEEKPLWSGRYTFKALAGWQFLWTLWLVALLVIWFFGMQPTQRDNPIFRYLFLALVLLPLLYLLGLYFQRWIRARYRLTTHRLFIESGFLGRKLLEIDLGKIADVSVTQHVFNRILDVGHLTVYATDADTPRLALEGVEHPLQLKEWIVQHGRARRLEERRI